MRLAQTRGGRRVLFAALYLSEGAPIGFVWWALPTRMRQEGVPVDEITAVTALLVLPWALKFLWAPAVDALRGPAWGYRHWIVTAQIAMAATILPLAWLDLRADLGWVQILLIAHAFCAATQDVAIDAWAIRLTAEHERGSLSGVMQAGMLVGRWVFGAGLLLAGGVIGESIVMLGLFVAILGSIGLVVVAGNGVSADARADEPRGSILRALGEVLTRKTTWLGLGIALTAGAAFEGVGAVAGPFLIDRGHSEQAVGGFYTASVVAMLLGALGGGVLADRRGHRRALALSVLGVAAWVFVIAGAEAVGAVDLLLPLMVCLYAGIGALTASSYALFMDLTDPRLAGTQFSAFMGATNGCEAWAAAAAGSVAVAWGYAPAFAALALASLVALIFLSFSQNFGGENEPRAQATEGAIVATARAPDGPRGE